MKRTTTTVDETAAPYRAMPLWVTLPPNSGASSSAPGRKAQPLPPHATVVERPRAARRNAGGQPAGLLIFAIQPAEIGHERAILPPFFPTQRVSTIDSRPKPNSPRGLGVREPVAMVFESQSGLSGRSARRAGRELTIPPPMAPEPHTTTENWRATAIGPSDLITTELVSVPFQPQAGTAGRISRPQVALRELVLSPLRASSGLRVLPPFTGGVHLALPPAETATHVTIPTSVKSDIWKTETAVDLPSNRFLRESGEIRRERELSTEGARTPLRKIRPVPATAPFPAGLTTPFQNGEPKVGGENPPIKAVDASLPLPGSAVAPRPVVALPTGLVVWTGVLNSYVRRIVCSPRLREGVRDVHALRLAPTKKIKEERKISGALLCSTTETLPISDSGSELLAGKGEVNGKARIEYADPRRA
jgi:hypothetical protein